MRRTVLPLAATLVIGALAPPVRPAPIPAPPAEAWVYARTEQGGWVVRVAGGPPKQVASGLAPCPGRVKTVQLPNDPHRYGQAVDGGKRVVYSEDVPETYGKEKQVEDWRRRLVLADADGKNPRPVLSGLDRIPTVLPAPDDKSVVCVAEQGGKWDVYRVPFDGTPPAKLSQTSGIVSPYYPALRVLPDGRVVYHAITGQLVEKHRFGKSTTYKGPVLLTDGKNETALFKEVVGLLPEMTADRVAVAGTNARGEEVVEVTDLKTGGAEEFPVSAFRNGWTCRVDRLRFSPDGRALAVSFSPGNVVFGKKGPPPGDEAVGHFGVIWLDGRKDRTQLFKIDQPLDEHGYFPYVHVLEWALGPVAKK